MTTNFFGFQFRPFDVLPDRRFFYTTPTYEAAYNNLRRGIIEGNDLVLLTGEGGTGKTTLLLKLLDDLDPTVLVFYVPSANVTLHKFLDCICDQLGLRLPQARHGQKLHMIKESLAARRHGRKTAVVLIDEAERLGEQVLKNLQLLLRPEAACEPFFQMVLVGLPTLEEILEQPKLREMNQHIARRCRLDRLQPSEISAYIHHRLRMVGCYRDDLFTRAAIEHITLYAKGIPRSVNQVCEFALASAHRNAQTVVSLEMVEQAVVELGLVNRKSESRPILVAKGESVEPSLPTYPSAHNEALQTTSNECNASERGRLRTGGQSLGYAFQALKSQNLTRSVGFVGTTGGLLALAWVLILPSQETELGNTQALLTTDSPPRKASALPRGNPSRPVVTARGVSHSADGPSPARPSRAELPNNVAKLGSKLHSQATPLDGVGAQFDGLEKPIVGAEETVAENGDTRRESIGDDIDGRSAVVQSVLNGATVVSYVTRTGDTLWDIARKYDVGVAQMRRWNKVPKGVHIRPGRLLIVSLGTQDRYVPESEASASPTNGDEAMIRALLRGGPERAFGTSADAPKSTNPGEAPWASYFAPSDPAVIEALTSGAVTEIDAGWAGDSFESIGNEAVAQATPEEAEVPAAGQFTVDKDAAERALERTLVEAGALLLPFGQAEVAGGFTYTRSERDIPVFFTEGETRFIASEKVRRDIFDTNLALRFGLPLDSQLELNVPYRYVDESRVTEVLFSDRAETGGSGSGIGDVSVGLAKTLLREGRWWPDLIARVMWNTDTGKTSDNDVSLGSGFNEVEGSLTVLKRQDPLAFIGRAGYRKAFEKNNVQPGDELGFSIGAALAASPETSLRFVFNQTFVDEVEFDGRTVKGSDDVIGMLTLGAASIVGRRTLVDISTGFGVTDDAPDFSVGISASTRFDIPGRR